MIKRLLFPIAGSSSVESGLGTALTVATDFSAQLDVVFCRRSFQMEFPLVADDLGTDWITDTAKNFEKDEKRRVSNARKMFDRATNERNVPYQQYPSLGNMPAASWEVAVRPPAEELLHRSGAIDMVVVGRSTDSVGDLTRSLTETALFACGQPVLIASRDASTRVGKNILVCWNRSTPSARAVKNAMPFLQQADAVTLLTIATGAKEGTEANAVGQYLSLHGIYAEVVDIPNSSMPVSEQMLSEADNIGADLLVMGAFSHGRVREFVLGGVTRDMLEYANIPVLMSH